MNSVRSQCSPAEGTCWAGGVVGENDRVDLEDVRQGCVVEEVREDKELMQKEASGTSLECPGGCIVFPLIVQWADKNINCTRLGFI